MRAGVGLFYGRVDDSLVLSSGGGFGRGPGSSAGNRSIELEAHFSF